MKNKNDSDWTFTVRMHKIAAHSRISKGLRHVLLFLHSWACLLMGHVKKGSGPKNHKSRSEWPAHSWNPSILLCFSIRIGRKAMTLGGDSSRAAIARSSAIRVTKRRASRNLNWLRMTVYRDHLNCGCHSSIAYEFKIRST